jgi:hypothetical protein
MVFPTMADLPANVWLLGFELMSAKAVAPQPAPTLVIVVRQRSELEAVAADVERMRARWPAAVVVTALQ